MKIIDFEKKGNVVRFWLGDDDCNDYWADDMDDVPYEHNAGVVYCQYRKGYKDISFPFDWDVCEPCDGEFNSPYSKLDMKNCKVPCIVAAPEEENNSWYEFSFRNVVGRKDAIRYYFGDKLEPDMLCEYDEKTYKLKYISVDNKE